MPKGGHMLREYRQLMFSCEKCPADEQGNRRELHYVDVWISNDKHVALIFKCEMCGYARTIHPSVELITAIFGPNIATVINHEPRHNM
jgi:hypothetical protein